MDTSWLSLVSAGVSGGVIFKLFEFGYKEYRRRLETAKSAKDIVNKHLDPILKSADELVGKIRSLAQSDFRDIISSKVEEEKDLESRMPILEILFLFSQLWARIQILRVEGLYVNISSDEKGKQLLDFFRALEATRTRLIERAWQRGIGEAIIVHQKNGMRILSYFEFGNQYQTSREFQEWFKPLKEILNRIHHARIRQRLLVYGTIVHALTETLDDKHEITRDRPGWVNKLSVKSRRELQHRIFKIYLPFVSEKEAYYKTVSGTKTKRP